jgi:hypothetical protein
VLEITAYCQTWYEGYLKALDLAKRFFQTDANQIEVQFVTASPHHRNTESVVLSWKAEFVATLIRGS